MPSQRNDPTFTYCLGIDSYGEEWVDESYIVGVIPPEEDPGPHGWVKPEDLK
jgi:hypothetical protein